MRGLLVQANRQRWRGTVSTANSNEYANEEKEDTVVPAVDAVDAATAETSVYTLLLSLIYSREELDYNNATQVDYR